MKKIIAAGILFFPLLANAEGITIHYFSPTNQNCPVYLFDETSRGSREAAHLRCESETMKTCTAKHSFIEYDRQGRLNLDCEE